MILREKKGEGCDSREINRRHLLRVIAPSKQALLFVSLVSLLNLVLFFCVFHFSFFFFFFLFLASVNQKGEGIGGDRQEHVKLGGRVRGRSPVRSCFSVRVCACASACVFASMSECVCASF